MVTLSTSTHRIVVGLGLLVVGSLGLAGCVNAGVGAWPVAVLVSALSLLGLLACGRSTALRDASVDSGVNGPADATADGAGTWEPCCEDGLLTTCYCMAGWACNYGRGLVDCGGGTCVYNDAPFDPTPCDPWDDGPFDMGVDASDEQGTPP